MADETKNEEVKEEEPKPAETETPEAEKPKAEEPKKTEAEEPKAEEPKKTEAEKPKAEKPKAEEPKAEEAAKPKVAKAKKSAAIEGIMTAIKGMTVLELAELVKALETEFGVSAAAPVAVAASSAAPVGGAATPEAAEEQTEFTVILTEIGENKINVIKAVRELTSLGLKESKDLVEAAPKPVKEGINKDDAAAAKAKLEAAGAKAEIK